MRYIRSLALFWWDFVVGDDWLVAAGVALALGLTYVLAHNGVNAWWLLAVAVPLVLGFSLWRETRLPSLPPRR